MAVYRPHNVMQEDGSVHQYENCTMASAATAIDRHTLGTIKTTGARMRSCQGDKVGGTDLIDARDAWSNCWGQHLDVRLKISWSTFIAALKAGRGAVLVGWYSKIPVQYRGQVSANYGHAIYINEVRPTDGALLMYDPLRKNPVWVPQIHIKRFAGAMRTTIGPIGYGFAQAAFTKVTSIVAPPAPSPAPTVKLRYGGVKIAPNTFAAAAPARQRRSPYIRRDNTVHVVVKGTKFKTYQRTNSGTNVGGSKVWYGDITGTLWMHKSMLVDIKG